MLTFSITQAEASLIYKFFEIAGGRFELPTFGYLLAEELCAYMSPTGTPSCPIPLYSHKEWKIIYKGFYNNNIYKMQSKTFIHAEVA